MNHWRSLLVLLLATAARCFVAVVGTPIDVAVSDLPSSYDGQGEPALHEFVYDVGDGSQKTKVYIEPNVTTFYRGHDTCPASQKVTPLFNGFSAKFINMSNKKLRLYWEVKKGGDRSFIAEAQPFQSVGTASFPLHRFVLVDEVEGEVVQTFVMTPSTSVYHYDPYFVEDDPEQSEENLAEFTPAERAQYDRLRQTVLFHAQYQEVTGRSYLGNYRRAAPREFMWPADYLGQTHWVASTETHFVQLPPQDSLQPSIPAPETHTPVLTEYRNASETPYLNMTLKVLSCAPRVFEIQNFLSPAEVAHLHELAGTETLHRSKTGGGSDDRTKTRTSYNSWLYRDRSLIVDAIYRRAADLERIDEALLRRRGPGERPDVANSRSYAEPLQLVHYDVGQEYTAHHDYGYSTLHNKGQVCRFSTLLLYLNEPEEGGETSFPRWSNAETFHELTVKPEVGKAILFYSQLPDGNLDDLSQHRSIPVKRGEKWLVNLWVSNPEYIADEY